MKKDRIAALVALGGFIGGSTMAALGDKAFRVTVSRSAAWQYGRGKRGNGAAVQSEEDVLRKKYGEAYDMYKAGSDWLDRQRLEHVMINTTSEDLMLHGYYYHAEDPKRIVLMAHGYRGSFRQFAGIAEWLGENGSDMLLIDQRGCGISNGEWITYGAMEKLDVLDWLSWIHDHNYLDLPVYMYGISLGAATVLCASEYEFSDDVRGIIADSGYVNMKEITTLYFRKWYPMLPASVMVRMIGTRCKSDAGFDMGDADAKKALGKCRLPVLFIHGTADDFVPPSHTERNYAACASADKRVLWVEDAGHVRSWYKDPERYRQALSDFFERTE